MADSPGQAAVGRSTFRMCCPSWGAVHATLSTPVPKVSNTTQSPGLSGTLSTATLLSEFDGRGVEADAVLGASGLGGSVLGGSVLGSGSGVSGGEVVGGAGGPDADELAWWALSFLVSPSPRLTTRAITPPAISSATTTTMATTRPPPRPPG